MTMTLPAGSPARPYFGASAWALGVIALTALHHGYGAVIYNTPWRLDAVYIGVPVGLVIAALLAWARGARGTRAGRILVWSATVIILIFPVLLIGIYEGGYNHLVKVIVYFGLGAEAALAMFPPPLYEMPNDLFYELTGIAQVPLALVAAWAALRLWRVAR